MGAEAHAIKQEYKWACSNSVFSRVSQKSIYLPPMDSLADVGTLPTWKKGTRQPSQTTGVSF